MVAAEVVSLCSEGGGRRGMFVSMWRARLRAVSSILSSSELFEYMDEGEEGVGE